MALFRRLACFANKINGVRSYVASNKFVDLTYHDEGYVTVTMNKPPVNTLNVDLLESLVNTFEKLEKDKCEGMILTSALPTVFSAGLDIGEILDPDEERFKQFWTALQNTWIKLYSSPYPTVAAVNGHSPAGGCLLALACERRIMLKQNFTIGLNETQLNILPPSWLQETMKNTIGVRQAELALISGKLFSSEEALKIGLVDELADSTDDLMQKCIHFLDKQLNLPAVTRRMVKQLYREETVKKLLLNKEQDREYFFNYFKSSEVQKSLESYMDKLKKKK